MHNVTFISTVHKEIGKSNADELCGILEKIGPEVVFLEALENTYSKYDENLFTSIGVFHKKLELKAIQKYSGSSPIEYVPVLDIGLANSWDKKYSQVCENIQLQKMIDDFNNLASLNGFQFLNSLKSIDLQEQMRMLENHLLNDTELNEIVNQDIEAYENSMMKNIYSFCRNNQFDKAVFLCGVAHRGSIIEKTGSFNSKEEIDLNWVIYGD